MTGGHLTPRRVFKALSLGALVLVLVVGLLWWRHARALPQERAGRLLAASPALRLPSRPDGLVVLARPGGWARFLARNPERRVLLDTRWWESLNGGGAESGSRAAVPGAVVALLLDQVRNGVSVAWWRDGWVVQGAVRGGRTAQHLAELLPASLEGRWRLHGGVFRIASRAELLEGEGWTVAPSVDQQRRLACWLWYHGTEWAGRWEGERLLLERGSPTGLPLPDPRGTVLARLRDGRRFVDLVAARLPARGVVAGIGERLDGLLARPVVLWLRRLEGGSALPHPRMALELHLTPDEDAERVAGELREVLCPLGCTTEDGALSNGREATRWNSALGSWWVVVLPGDAVAAATGRGQLETLLGARATWPGGEWAVIGADAAASSLEALSSARLLTVFGVVRPEKLDLLRRLAVPLRGLRTLTWRRDADGARVEMVPAPAG